MPLQGYLLLALTVVLVVVAAVVLASPRTTAADEPGTAKSAVSTQEPIMNEKTYTKPADAELVKTLTPMQYHVTQKSGTEPPFRNDFWDNHEAGLYVDVVTGEPLFSSADKFNSGTGWPSFTKPLETSHVKDLTDDAHGMTRTEVRSKIGDSHLGHVFDDGPAPTHQRYCINSASLRFVPVAKLDAEGYGKYRPLIDGHAATIPDAQNNTCAAPKNGAVAGCKATVEEAILAGGCFWGMQDLLRKIPGVISTEVGYCGGKEGVTYDDVHSGTSGNAEAVKITFDTTQLKYKDLLEMWYFRMHDPTTPNRQGNDVGSQYRSAIFYTSAEQKKLAEESKADIDKSGKWKRPLVTEISKAGKFTRAEGYHQDYLVNNPGGYSCHFLRDWKDMPLKK